jgi:hypothetical protein
VPHDTRVTTPAFWLCISLYVETTWIQSVFRCIQKPGHCIYHLHQIRLRVDTGRLWYSRCTMYATIVEILSTRRSSIMCYTVTRWRIHSGHTQERGLAVGDPRLRVYSSPRVAYCTSPSLPRPACRHSTVYSLSLLYVHVCPVCDARVRCIENILVATGKDMKRPLGENPRSPRKSRNQLNSGSEERSNQTRV